MSQIRLPNRWAFKHGAFYYRPRKDERGNWNDKAWYRLGASMKEARAEFERVSENPIVNTIAKGPKGRHAPWCWEYVGYSEERCQIPLTYLQDLYRSSHASARKRKIGHTLCPEEMVRLAERSSGACEVSGIHWRYTCASGRRRRLPFVPSLDRIDSEQGYVYENCRLVCAVVNLALNDFGDEVLIEMATAIAKRAAE